MSVFIANLSRGQANSGSNGVTPGASPGLSRGSMPVSRGGGSDRRLEDGFAHLNAVVERAPYV